ncbi:hypothetical protein BOO86_00210 [Mycobacterium sp. CBMA 234]|uniref:DUF732 domain-containing protein n=1 Tax=Mycolicibacterium sp. CBMA 234 TaxID=1918495 RepID=UPI0012DD28B2|nr:DUF732 domain-containing protein [Mycolicibacterium sp. CBMA 234]MUL62868.1 hypothetical protein [Mycolicibacterium sp. CBMA 234]
MALIALVGPAAAHADARDDDFVNNLAGQGITGDPAKLVSTARMVCTAGTQTASTVPAGLGRLLPMGYVVTTLHLNMGQVNQFVDAARATYCPDPASPPPAVPAVAGLPPVPGMDRLAGALGATG